MIKVLGISASPRRQATDYAVKAALAKAEEHPGIVTEFISLRGKKVELCNHCDSCFRNKSACIQKDDMPELTEAFVGADAYIIGTPVYTYNPSPQILTFFNRLRPLRYTHPQGLFGKVGGVIAVGGTRNGGQEMAINSIINCYLARGIMVVGGSTGNYTGGKVWTADDGARGAKRDDVGMLTVTDIGDRVARAALLIGKEG